MSLWEIGFWAGIFLAVVGFAGMAVSTLLIDKATRFQRRNFDMQNGKIIIRWKRGRLTAAGKCSVEDLPQAMGTATIQLLQSISKPDRYEELVAKYAAALIKKAGVNRSAALEWVNSCLRETTASCSATETYEEVKNK